MTKRMRCAFSAVIAGTMALSLAACGVDGKDAAQVVQEIHSWGNYHWERDSNPITIPLGDNLSGKWPPHLATASSDWNKSRVVQTTIVPGGTNPRQCKPTEGRTEVCNERYGNNGWLGVAQIWASGDHIVQGVVKVNDYYYAEGSSYDTPAWRLFVMCQEVGHIFGLDHQDENFNNPNLGTCMDYTGNPDSNQHPDQHDYDQLEDIYAHLDSGGGGGGDTGNCPPRNPHCSGNAPPPASGDLNSPSDWGELASTAPGGGTSVFVRDLGGGWRMLTHVIWAL